MITEAQLIALMDTLRNRGESLIQLHYSCDYVWEISIGIQRLGSHPDLMECIIEARHTADRIMI